VRDVLTCITCVFICSMFCTATVSSAPPTRLHCTTHVSLLDWLACTRLTIGPPSHATGALRRPGRDTQATHCHASTGRRECGGAGVSADAPMLRTEHTVVANHFSAGHHPGTPQHGHPRAAGSAAVLHHRGERQSTRRPHRQPVSAIQTVALHANPPLTALTTMARHR
jgi:hypothetical protein